MQQVGGQGSRHARRTDFAGHDREAAIVGTEPIVERAGRNIATHGLGGNFPTFNLGRNRWQRTSLLSPFVLLCEWSRVETASSTSVSRSSSDASRPATTSTMFVSGSLKSGALIAADPAASRDSRPARKPPSESLARALSNSQTAPVCS